MLLVTAYPMLRALYLSLFQLPADGAGRPGVHRAAATTSRSLTDPLFWQTSGNTVFIMVVTVGVELVIGFAFAMVMHRVIFARGVIRTSILIPYGIITVVSAFAWQFAFSLNNGFVNGWLPFVGDDFNWFGAPLAGDDRDHASRRSGRPRRSCRCCCWPAWRRSPRTCIEAAKVDGATWWQRLCKVILPNMRAAIMVAVLFRALDAYRIFDNIFVMTDGAAGHRVGRRSSPTGRSSSSSSSAWARRCRCCCSCRCC